MTKSLVLETTGRYLVLLNNVNIFGVMSAATFQSTMDNDQDSMRPYTITMYLIKTILTIFFSDRSLSHITT